jgi:hypothetical protein
MVVAAALVSFAAGLVAGRTMLRRVRPRTGTSWEEWRDADYLGGRWAWLIFYATCAAVGVGVYGFGTPWPLRAALLGVITGSCVPFAMEGLRRYRRARLDASRGSRPAPSWRPPPDAHRPG